MRRSTELARSLLLGISLLLAAQSASAIVTVGPNTGPGGCRFRTVQEAIDYVLGYERFHPDEVDPYIGVAGDYFYNEALVIDSSNVAAAYTDPFGQQGAFVQIYGNYDGFCNDIPNGSTARIGAGGGKSGNSVLEIKGSKPVRVILNHLDLTDAGPNSSGDIPNGGGIAFRASAAGYLDLTNVDILGNHASYGGGIYANGHIPGLTVALHAGTRIENNIADYDGGGIEAVGETFLYATENPVVVLNNTAGVHGGGIDFNGRGSLNVGNNIFGNQAGYGGGINAHGNGGPVQVSLDAGTLIYNNTASHDGGGVQIEGNAHLLMIANPSAINYNHAGVRGGGLQVVGPAEADIGSPGYAGVGAISSNDAQDGGGISAWVDGESVASVYLFSTDALQPLRISNNIASSRGGGIFANAWTPTFNPVSFNGLGSVRGFGVHIDGNVAANGAAIYGDDSESPQFNAFRGAEFLLTKDQLDSLDPSVAVFVAACVLGAPCNTIDGNETQDIYGGLTDGSVVFLTKDSSIVADQIAMRGNSGGSLMNTSSLVYDEVAADLTSCLIAYNTATASLIYADDLWLRNCTVASNTIGGHYVLEPTGSLLLHRVILFQPGNASTSPFGDGDMIDIITHDRVTLGSGPTTAQVIDPLFVDPAHGDYHLQPDSRAVDFSDCCPSLDLDGRDRGKALLRSATRFDVGAYELQSLGDVVFKNKFE